MYLQHDSHLTPRFVPLPHRLCNRILITQLGGEPPSLERLVESKWMRFGPRFRTGHHTSCFFTSQYNKYAFLFLLSTLPTKTSRGGDGVKVDCAWTATVSYEKCNISFPDQNSVYHLMYLPQFGPSDVVMYVFSWRKCERRCLSVILTNDLVVDTWYNNNLNLQDWGRVPWLTLF